MKAWFNGKKIDLEELGFESLQRGLDYGDGLFETIFVKKGVPVFLDFHVDRISTGLEILGGMPEFINIEKLNHWIRDLWDSSGRTKTSTAKIRIWRSSSVGYAPSNNLMNLMVTLSPSPPYTYKQIGKFGIIKIVNNRPEPLSHFKTLSSLKYVLAGKEQHENSWEEGILLDEHGLFSEGINSNLFLWDGEHWLTPGLSTGCVEGVMRRFILNSLEDEKSSLIQETDLNPQKIDLNKSLWFTVNSLVLKYFLPEGKDDQPLKEIMEKLREVTD